MHHNDRAAFLLCQIEAESTRAITPYCASPTVRNISESQATLDSCPVSCVPIYGAHLL
jgi:hypothetical protein